MLVQNYRYEKIDREKQHQNRRLELLVLRDGLLSFGCHHQHSLFFIACATSAATF